MANFQVDMNKATEYDGLLAASEKRNGLPDGMLKLVMMIENRNNPKNRVSPKGASGVMQIMPANFESLGITDPNDPAQSIEGAGKLMAQLSKQYNGDSGAMLAHYNGGNVSGKRYLEGKSLNPETAQYINYASEYLQSSGKTSKYGLGIEHAGVQQATGFAPSDLVSNPMEGLQDEDTFAQGYQDVLDVQLAREAQFYELSMGEAAREGFASTLTNSLKEYATREQDENWRIGDAQFDSIKQTFPQGVSEAQQARLYNSRSQVDFDHNVQRTQQENEFGKKLVNQTGWSKAGAYAGLLAGGLADPVGLPAGSFGVGARIIKGGGVAATVGRSAVEGAAGMAVVSSGTQLVDKGSVSGGDLLQHVGTGAIFGATMGAVAKAAGWSGKSKWDAEQESVMQARMDGNPIYGPPKPEPVPGQAVNFRDAVDSHVGDSGEIIGVGPSEVRNAAERWDETFDTDAQATVNARRQWYYNNETRAKVSGWADSEGVQIARSKSKVARFIGAQWSGNSAGLGKQEASTVNVLKEQMKEQMQWEYTPALKEQFENFMTPAEKIDYMAGGAKDAQTRFSKEVQMERYRHRQYRMDNEGSSKGYQSDSPAAVQVAAKTLDDLTGRSKSMHMQYKTEHAETLAKSDHVGYIEQRPDYRAISSASPAKRKAFLDMVKDDYHAEASAKLNKLKGERAEWIEAAYKRFEGNMELPGIKAFLDNPNKYFDDHVAKLGVKLHKEMDVRASHWWDNAIKDPQARYQNSEASLLSLAKEMSGEWFTGRDVDADLVASFQKSLTEKWADTSRRELNMLNSRKVDGQDVHMLDMFEHDVFSSSQKTMNDTAGRVAFAKKGWNTEQDIADSLDAMRHSGATEREVQAAKHVSDIILNRAGGLDNSPLVQAVSNLTHAAMMGKLATSLVGDLPTIIGNLGVSGMFDALGKMGKTVVDGSMFVSKSGRPTKLGNDLEHYLTGLTGHDNELWIPQQLNADGAAMEYGGSLLRRSAASARFTNTLSGANALSRSIGIAVTKTTTQRFHKYLRTGKGLDDVRLGDVGLHKEQIGRIKKQFDAHSSVKDFGLDKWTDPIAKQDFISGVHRFTNQNTLNKAYAGDDPKWVRDNILGYLFSRFRTIGIRAQEKVLVRNLTIADSNTAAMLAGGLAFTTFLAYGRIYLDAATSKDGRKVLKDRLTPAGVADTVFKLSSITGLAAEGSTFFNLMTGGGVQGGSDTPLTGAIGNFTKAAGALGQAATGNGEWSSAGDAAFKLLPGANSYTMLGIKKLTED